MLLIWEKWIDIFIFQKYKYWRSEVAELSANLPNSLALLCQSNQFSPDNNPIFHFSSNLAQSDQVLPDYSNANLSCLKEVSNYAAWTTFTFQWVQSFTIITELSPKAQNAISSFQEVLNEKTLYIVIENSQKKKVCNARFFDNSALKTKHFFSDKNPQLSKGKVFLISIFWLRGTSLWII